MIKKIICVLLCLCMVLGLSACMGNDENPDTTDSTSDTQPTENPSEGTQPTNPDGGDYESEEYRKGSAEDVAQRFIKSLIALDYETALRCFDVPTETPFFTKEDVEWYLPRSNYAELLDLKFENYTVTVDKRDAVSETAICDVTIKDGASDKSKMFRLPMHLDKNNKWGVKDNGFYLDEYYVVAPGGKTILLVDGEDATDFVVGKFGQSQYQCLYKLQNVGKSEKTLSISSTNFASIDTKIYPTLNKKDEPLKLVASYVDSKALDTLSNTWNEMYDGVLNNKTYSEMVHLLSPTAEPAIAQTCMSGIKQMLGEGSCHDFAISKMWYCSPTDGYETMWLSSDKLQVCFNYSLIWTYEAGAIWGPEQESMTKYDIIILHYDGEKFTLDTISTNNTFFTERHNNANDVH